jgi:transcriptional antiterminator RfaH
MNWEISQPAGTGPQAALRSSGVATALSWFLILTKPAGEQVAQSNLERQGFRVYYPRLLRPSLRRGHWTDRIVSLFPRYLFVQLDAARQSLAPVRSTLGVSGIIRFGHEAAVVPDSIIDALQKRADPTSGLHRLASDGPFKTGARVSVIAGAFQGLEGIFERETGEERAIVLLDLLGKATPVRVPLAYVAPKGCR